MPKKLQGAVIVGYVTGYDPTTTHVKMQKSPAIVVARIVGVVQKCLILGDTLVQKGCTTSKKRADCTLLSLGKF